MAKENETISAKKTIHLSISGKLYQDVQEMAGHYGGVEVPEMIRTALTRFYNDTFRKEAYGYMAGTSERTLVKKTPGAKISDREEMVLRLNNMTNDEVTAWITSGDFMTKSEKEAEDWMCRTSPDTGKREIYGIRKNMGPESKYERTVMDWPMFISEVRKYYKAKAVEAKDSK